MSLDSIHARLIAWNDGVRQYLGGTCYTKYADDVSQQYVLELLEKEHECDGR